MDEPKSISTQSIHRPREQQRETREMKRCVTTLGARGNTA